MKKIPLSIMMLSVIAVVISCTSSGKLTRRYKSIELQIVSDIENSVAVNAFVLDPDKVSSTPGKTIFDLSEKAQKELITALNGKETTSDKFTQALTSSLTAKQDTKIDVIDFTQMQKRLIVSVKNLQHWPADRISKISIDIAFNSKEIALLSCNKLITEFQTLDLGKVNFSNSVSGELNASLSTGLTGVVNPTSSTVSKETNTDNNKNVETTLSNGLSNTNTTTSAQGLSGKLTAARSFAEEVMLRQRMVNLNASIHDNTLNLYQESISGLDLTGNIIADITFDGTDIAVKKVYSFTNLIDAGSLSDAAKIKGKETFITYFNVTSDISATITFEADFRHVDTGHHTTSESDDKVILRYGKSSASNQFLLLKAEKLKPKLYHLRVSGDASKLPVEIASPSQVGSGTLIFPSFNDAREFLVWLKMKNPTVTNRELEITDMKYKLKMPAAFTTLHGLEIFPE